MGRELFASFQRRLQLNNLAGQLTNRRFLRSGGLLLLANGLVAVLGLVRTPVMTWILPKDEVGMFGLIGSWVPFVQLLSISGIDSAAYHYVAKGRTWAFVVGLIHRLRWSILASAAFLAIALYWFLNGSPAIGWMFLIAGISFPFTYGMTASAGMLGAQENFRGLFWYRLGESLTDFTGFLPLVFSAWWISRAVTFYGANQLATAAMQVGVSIGLVMALKREGIERLEPEEQKEMLRYGKHLTALTGISVVQARSDALLVGLLLPLETMADYSIALLVFEQIKRLWGIYTTLRYPPLVRLPLIARRRRFISEGVLVLAVFIILGVLLALAGHLLIPMILPPIYASSLGYMDILIATIIVGMPGGMVELYFRTQQDERRQYLMRSTAAVVGVAAPAGLIFIWGAYGAAAGRLLANLVLSILGAWLFLKEIRGDSKVFSG